MPLWYASTGMVPGVSLITEQSVMSSTVLALFAPVVVTMSLVGQSDKPRVLQTTAIAGGILIVFSLVALFFTWIWFSIMHSTFAARGILGLLVPISAATLAAHVRRSCRCFFVSCRLLLGPLGFSGCRPERCPD